MGDDTEMDTRALDRIIKAIKHPPIARVGVLGDKDARIHYEGENPSNATIGLFHEFGTSKLPQRSFLRIPISENLQKYMERAGAFTKDTMDEIVRIGDLTPFVKKLAILGEAIVADAFDSSGFGKWKPSNMARKKIKQTLVETQQLRNSITSEVK